MRKWRYHRVEKERKTSLPSEKEIHLNGYGRGADNQERGKGVVTRETFGMTFLIFSVVLLVIATLGRFIFGEIGVNITAFLLGTFGYFVYPLLVLCFYGSVCMVAGKNLIPAKFMLKLTAVLFAAFLIAHLATSTRLTGEGYGAYLSGCYTAAAEGAATAGGAAFGLVVYPVQALISPVGAYVLFGLLAALALFVLLWATPLKASLVGTERTRAPKPPKAKRQKGEPSQRSQKRQSPQEVPSAEPAAEYAGYGYGEPYDEAAYADTYGDPYDINNYYAPEPQNMQGYYVPQAPEQQNMQGYYPPQYQPQNGYTQNGYAPQNMQGYPQQYRQPQQTHPQYPSYPESDHRQQPQYGYGQQYQPQNGYGQNGYVGYYGQQPSRPVQGYYAPQDRESQGYGRNGHVGYYGTDRPSAPETPRSYSGRDILFSNTPAQDYTKNLIYNQDSYFNSRVRRSSVEPDTSPVRKPDYTIGKTYERPVERGERLSERKTLGETREVPRYTDHTDIPRSDRRGETSRSEGRTSEKKDDFLRPDFGRNGQGTPQSTSGGVNAGTTPAPSSYRNAYSEQEEKEPRGQMPRKVVHERPEPRRDEQTYSFRAEDLNYPRVPVFKSPETTPEQTARDAYANDVDDTEFSSAPSIDDIAEPPAPAESELRRARRDPAPEPVRTDFPEEPNPFDTPRAEDAADRSRSFDTRERSRGERSRGLDVNNERSRGLEDAGSRSDRFDDTNSRTRGLEADSASRETGRSFGRTEEAPVPEPQPQSEDDYDPRASERGFRSLFSSQRGPDRVQLKNDGVDYVGDVSRERNARRFDETDTKAGFGSPAETGRTSFKPEPPVSDRRTSFEPEPPAETRRAGFGDQEVSDRRTTFEPEPPAETGSFEDSRAVRGLRNGRTSAADLFDDDDISELPEVPAAAPAPVRAKAERGGGGESVPDPMDLPAPPAPKPKKHTYKRYRRPSLDLFKEYDDSVTVSPKEIEYNSSVIVETLEGFRVDANIVKVTSGPAVTRYDIDIPRNISVRSVIRHDEEIAMRLHARDGVNMYSNSEVGAISIEVPNAHRAMVGIRSLMASPDYRNDDPTKLMFVIGKDVEGRAVCGDIVKMTHILVAGTTNSGKSVCLNSMLISLIAKYSPEDLRLILVDPKKNEFVLYEGLPHLMINEIITDAQKAIMALNWAIKEMERRYDVFEQKTRSGTVVRNINDYNANLTPDEEKLPKIVVVVDELADLMSVAKKDIEERIQRLTQKARAAGIHLVIATQRPSVDVITGVIKGNLPTRMAFRVIQEVDSRTILDESGAEKLLGNGDMLYKTGGMFNCLRVQGAFVGNSEAAAVVQNIKENNEAYFDQEVSDYINRTSPDDGGSDDDDDGDGGSVGPEYIKALAIVVKLGSASISLIQRKCGVGYNHAGKIIEWMELMGYISPFDGKAKARTTLLTKEEFESKYGNLD